MNPGLILSNFSFWLKGQVCVCVSPQYKMHLGFTILQTLIVVRCVGSLLNRIVLQSCCYHGESGTRSDKIRLVRLFSLELIMAAVLLLNISDTDPPTWQSNYPSLPHRLFCTVICTTIYHIVLSSSDSTYKPLISPFFILSPRTNPPALMALMPLPCVPFYVYIHERVT